ncbi:MULTISPECIES: DUF4232 domain-containing protein [Catenuloplanes]|uniref:DUF4232 domain-containing protein n=1 Tax=Catenuloplanes niger TaxID=587534 RepID=A0AAE4A0C3_9ACTN|nr:DUF4232 domain-containing protein [Catenuloplanes niger]MDR7326880.1 hypothetical protein [Catenuloplanes niger]
MRRLAYPVIALLLLSGCGPGGPGQGGDSCGEGVRCAGAEPSWQRTDAPPSPAATCGPEGVRLELAERDAAMGLRALGVWLVNCGTVDYRVDGYPDVAPLGAEREPLDVRVLDGVTEIAGALPRRSDPPRPVVVRPGERASAIVVWRNTYDDTRRPPVVVSHLAVAPAAGRPATVLGPDGGLDLGSTGRLGVSPWLIERAPGEAAPTGTPPAPPSAPHVEPSRPLL